MARLFSQHDPAHVHAILGALSLVSFLYYYGNVVYHGRLPADGVPPYVMLLHLSLSLSSILFAVPRRRIRRNPTLIWFEYRAHAVIFTLRSVAIYVANHYLHSAAVVRLGVVLCTGAAADYVSRVYGEEGITTVRGNGKYRDARVKMIVPFYSVYQICASASHIYDYNPVFSGYNTLIAIQSSAFGMTLVRKGIVGWKYHAAGYSFCLLLSMYAMWLQVIPPHRYGFWILCALVSIGRIMDGVNKYALWCIFTCCFYALKLNLNQLDQQ